MTENQFKIKLSNQEITARKWKAKEKLAFIDIMKNNSDKSQLVDILVYNCIEEKVALSKDEYKYVLSVIRSKSLGDVIPLEFSCEHCERRFIVEIKLSEVIKPVFEESKVISTPKYDIELCEIQNVDYYKQVINQAADELDLYLRIKSINGNDGYTLEEIIEFFENLDVQDFDEIFEQWDKIKLKIQDIRIVKCPHCEGKTQYEFDEIPGFFPSSWFK